MGPRSSGDSLAAAWKWFYANNTDGHTIRCFNEAGWLADDSVYKRPSSPTKPQCYRVQGIPFIELGDAVEFAKKQLRQGNANDLDIMMEPQGIFVAFISDDANAITLHKLKTWPEGVEV